MGFKGITSFFKGFLKEKDKKSYSRIAYEFIHLAIIHKQIPYHYFSRFLYRNDFKEYKDFIPIKTYFGLIGSEKIHDPLYVNILGNKIFFELFCNQFQVPRPVMTSYNRNGAFYHNDSATNVQSNDGLVAFFSNIFKDAKASEIILKSTNTKGGAGIFILAKKSFREQIQEVGHLILSGTYVHQEWLEQHQEINKIYPHSINTIRLDIAIDHKGKEHLLGSVMRFGQGGNKIDNRSKGGFFVSIDQNGCLMRKGYPQRVYGSKELVNHPDTGFEFNGFKVPYYEEAKALALHMSQLIPNRVVGWDIAITPDGPMVVEGNHDSNIAMSEVAYGGYLKHPVVKNLVSAM
ncbi:sugar-transfer associated ATP-grasp domain-containing protein [Flagellimonas halotolerans]|uniref:Sugar-transfer associated ATP-grasp domain-containing protein n=1 Tax=Flagellimonas halotolerans TaxID=3112164 RepID=A0ABU6ISA8_9FLAO|nr:MULTISPECIES: sugar-transfer associated ATP-grasp domain-containing protein [unclassified Allomuricauda]MEC3966141.1 sugar-transfer associated ATP-grasp domain-containing protein [Muricauda sp. SYSU M86414]MEC4266006.1 sugar-transfer associated ATP-grasp domain-containing protein [Muricauda sp. SYSU M84420]